MDAGFPTTVVAETVAGLRFELEMVEDFDRFLDDYLARTAKHLERPPYCAHLWPASRALVAWMAERPDLWLGRRVLELGCGLGLPALAAAKLGARQVVACDSHPENGVFLRRNAARNGTRVEVLTMDWNQPALRPSFDRILASDVVYEWPMVEPLLRAVGTMLAPGGRFILADPGRPALEPAVAYAESLGFASILHAEDECFVVEFTRGTATPEARSPHTPE